MNTSFELLSAYFTMQEMQINLLCKSINQIINYVVFLGQINRSNRVTAGVY